jgi:hypothetical protein
VNKKKQKNFLSRSVDAGARTSPPDGIKGGKVFLVLFFQGLFGIVHRELMKAAAR